MAVVHKKVIVSFLRPTTGLLPVGCRFDVRSKTIGNTIENIFLKVGCGAAQDAFPTGELASVKQKKYEKSRDFCLVLRSKIDINGLLFPFHNKTETC